MTIWESASVNPDWSSADRCSRCGRPLIWPPSAATSIKPQNLNPRKTNKISTRITNWSPPPSPRMPIEGPWDETCGLLGVSGGPAPVLGFEVFLGLGEGIYWDGIRGTLSKQSLDFKSNCRNNASTSSSLSQRPKVSENIDPDIYPMVSFPLSKNKLYSHLLI